MSVTAYARTAGILYLIVAVFSAFAIAYVPSIIVVGGDAQATADNLMAHRALFGAGAVADVIVMVTEIALSVMLFVLFKPVSRTLSLIALASRLTMVVVMAINLLIHIMPMVLLNGTGCLRAFTPAQLQATALALFEAHRYAIYVWDIFFGFHLAVLGYLAFRSGHVPRLLGIAMLVGSSGYFFEGLRRVTFVDSTALAMIVAGLLRISRIVNTETAAS